MSEKRLKSVLFLCAVVFLFACSTKAGTYGGGSGTAGDPYLIYTPEQMNAIGANSLDWDKHFKLMADIDLGGYTGTAYNIIGSSGSPFQGVFDGNDHAISNFSYSYNGSNNHIGLFGYIDHADAAIKNLSVVDANVFIGSPDCEYIGTIAGILYKGNILNCNTTNVSLDAKNSTFVGGMFGASDYDGNISNCFVSGTISGTSLVGGLVGWTASIISDCHTSVTITAGSDSGGLAGGIKSSEISNCSSDGIVVNTATIGGSYTSYAGGLVGWAEFFSGKRISNISYCHSSCNVSIEGGSGNMIGGLVGYNCCFTVITHCYAAGNIEGDSYLGGLVGANYGGYIYDSFATGDVNGVESVGGLVGDNDCTISRCFATGNVTGEENVGGLFGWNFCRGVSYCYSSGSVTGNEYVGGFVGLNEGYRSGGSTDEVTYDCYATGSVSGGSYIGGFAGYNDDATISRCYSVGLTAGLSNIGGFLGGARLSHVAGCSWDANTSGQTTSAGGAGKTTAEMYDANTFTDAGWDFSTPVWKITEVPDYPYLWWQGPIVSNLEPKDNSLITTSFLDICVTFDRSVIGVDANDMLLSGDASISANVSLPVYLGDNTWKFQITNLVDGILEVSLAPSPNDIEGLGGNDLMPSPTKWKYNVLVLTPTLHAEPEITLGTNNLISWEEINNVEMYYVQCSNEPSFTNIWNSSGWIYDNSFDFNDLIFGQTYWYRAKAKTAPDVVTWLQTKQEDFEHDIINDVNVQSEPGNVVLEGGATLVDTDNIGGSSPSSWSIKQSKFNVFLCTSGCELVEIQQHLYAPSTQTLQLLVYESETKEGPYQRIHVNSISIKGNKWFSSGPISVQLVAGKYYTIGAAWSSNVRYFYHTTPVYEETTTWGQKVGSWRSGYPAPEQAGCFNDGYGYGQHLTTKKFIEYLTGGSVISTPIYLAEGGDWINFEYNATLPNETNLTIDVLDANDDSIIIADANDGEDISWIDVNSIKLRANLSTDDPNVTPALHDWSVTYTDPTTIIESDWSNVVWSRQVPWPVEVGMNLTPPVMHPRSKAKWVKAHFFLPEEYAVEDVDVNAPCRITDPFEPDIESDYMNVFINDDGLVEIEAAFERRAFCQAGISGETIEVRVEGRFTTGQGFFGTDTIRVIDNTFRDLAVIATCWLKGGCVKPDWCDGADVNQDSVIDFAFRPY
ncbi:MAG: GLUG motif-containing protein [Planctomycetota bacterium]